MFDLFLCVCVYICMCVCMHACMNQRMCINVCVNKSIGDAGAAERVHQEEAVGVRADRRGARI